LGCAGKERHSASAAEVASHSHKALENDRKGLQPNKQPLDIRKAPKKAVNDLQNGFQHQ
jgi:hypothetical protein